MPSPADTDRDTQRSIAERLLLASSVVLVVLTVIFSTFMYAEKFWQGEAIALHMKLTNPNVSASDRNDLKEKEAAYDEDHKGQEHYGRVFAGLISAVMFVTVACLPLGVWKESNWILRGGTLILMAVLGSTAVYGFGYAFGCVNP